MMKNLAAGFTWMNHNVFQPPVAFLWQHPGYLTAAVAVAVAAGVTYTVLRIRVGR